MCFTQDKRKEKRMSGLLSLGLGSLGNIFADLIDTILWSLCKLLFSALNTIENVFRALTGVNQVSNQSGGSGDVIVDVLQQPVTKNLMFALTLFGVCVLVLMVILAIIRNVYKDDSKVTVSSIFGQAIKAVMGFILIPALCLVGVMFSNVILRAVDGATKSSEAKDSSFTYGIISACATDEQSNPFQDALAVQENGELTELNEAIIIYCDYLYDLTAVHMGIYSQVNEVIDVGLGINTIEEANAYYTVVMEEYYNNFPNWHKYPDYHEDAGKYRKITLDMKYKKGGFLGIGSTTYYFANDYKAYFIGDKEVSDSDAFENYFNLLTEGDNPVIRDHKFTIKKTSSQWTNGSLDKAFNTKIDIHYFYAFIATLLTIMPLFKICMGLTKRIVQLIVLYVLSPIALAMYPWDNGSAFGSWKKDFVGYTIGAYGAVAGMNLTIQIMPIITHLQISASAGINTFIQLLLIIILAQGIGSLVSTLSGWIGAKDLLKEGGDTAKAVAAPVAAVAGAAIGAVAGGAAIVGSGIKHARSVHSAGKSAFNDEKESFLLGKKSEAEGATRSRLTHNKDGSEKSTAELAKSFNMKRRANETDEAFGQRVSSALDSRVMRAGENAYLDVNNEDAAIEAAFKAQKTAKQQARKDLKGTGGWATAGRAAGKLGTSALGLLGSSTGIDVQKAWKDGQTGVATDWKKTAEGTGIKFTGKTAENATAISNATHAGRIGAGLIGNTAIAASLGKDAQEAMDQLQTALTASLEQLRQEISENRTTPITMAELTTLLANPTLAKSAAESKAVNTYIRETRGADREMAILQNTIDATIAINSGFAGADEGKLRDLSRKGAADGFKDAKAYLLGEVQKSVEKSGKKWTGDMASEIEKQLDKYFKQNFKPNKD